MKYIINGSVYDFTKEELEYFYLDEGEEGICYRIRDYNNDFVMKIHHVNPDKLSLDEDTCNALKEINTKRVLLPNNLIYDEDGKYLGYTLDFIEYKRPRIRNLKIRRVIDEFYTLEKDVDLLTKNNVLIDDLRIFNTIFSDGIYVCDPGSFTLAKTKGEKRFLDSYNTERINEYELEEILFNLLKFGQKEKSGLKEFFKDSDGYYSDYMRCFCEDKEENAKEFFKGLIYR